MVGSIHGCIAGGQQPRAQGREDPVDAADVRLEVRPARSASAGAGPFVFSSMTWSTSSFDQAMRSELDLRDDLAGHRLEERGPRSGVTSSVSRSTIMYSSSTP